MPERKRRGKEDWSPCLVDGDHHDGGFGGWLSIVSRLMAGGYIMVYHGIPSLMIL